MVHSNYPVAKKGDHHETAAQYIHRTNLIEGVQLQRLNNGVWVYACEPMSIHLMLPTWTVDLAL
jgi:hypothetical protein